MNDRKVEKKVTWATVGSYIAAVVGLAVLTAVQKQPVLVSPLPDYLEPFLLGLVPGAIAFLSGYKAEHTPRG